MMHGKNVGALMLALAIAAAAFIGGSCLALAQDPQGGSEKQLDRIEQKLDRIIEHLGITESDSSSAKADNIRPSIGNDPSKAKNPTLPGTADAPQNYERGAVAIARVAPARTKDLAEIPADSIGGFIYIGGAIPLSELSRNGVVYPDLAAVELQGWLKVAEPGRTQLAVEYRITTGSNAIISPGCIASMWLEDRSIGSQEGEIPMPAREQKTKSFIFGADLQPGLYKLRAWLACTKPRDLRVLNAMLLIKTPADMNLRMIDSGKLLHRGK